MRAQIRRILHLLELGSGGGNVPPPPDEPDHTGGGPLVTSSFSTPPARKSSRVSMFSGMSGSLFGGLDDMEEDVGGEEAADDLEGIYALGQLTSRRRHSNLDRIVEEMR
jgi:hypothetical protein